MEIISSKSNTIIKDTKKLLTSSSARQRNSLFVLEGARLCFDVLNSVYEIKTLLVTEKARDKYPSEIEKLEAVSDRAYIITDEVCARLGDTATPQGIFAVCKMRQDTPELSNKAIALDRVQDPSNVGAIIRTAEALGIESIILYDCCDIYNPKALRASMGSVLRLGCIQCDDLQSTLKSLKERYSVYSTVPQSDAKSITEIDFSTPSICVIGNEANGVEDAIKALSDELITIPMFGRAESLNAGVAGAITMWEMMRQ